MPGIAVTTGVQRFLARVPLADPTTARTTAATAPTTAPGGGPVVSEATVGGLLDNEIETVTTDATLVRHSTRLLPTSSASK